MRSIAWLSVALALLYWVMESLMDTFLFEQGTFFERLFRPDMNEIWMRLMVVALIMSFGVYSQRMISKLRKSDFRFGRMNACFLDFGPDPVRNIDLLTALCGELLGSYAAFYNRMEQDFLSSWGKWCPSGSISAEPIPLGHVCRDLIQAGGDEVRVINNLGQTPNTSEESCVLSCGLRTYMGKAVRLGGESVGSLSVFFKNDFSPSEDDKRLIGIVAAAIGVEEIRRRAQIALRESEERLRLLSGELMNAQERERKHLAQQLHDSVGQSLSALKFGIEETLETLHGEVNQEFLKPMKASVPIIRQIIGEIRQIQRDLYPATLEDLGIIATINSFCKQYRDIYRDITVETRIELDEKDVPKRLKPVIYRIVQEAMNNIAKHSGAAFACIGLHRNAESLVLAVWDEGRGFAAGGSGSESFKKGLGLATMRERAELSGGRFTIDSREGRGTRIEVRWPGQNLDT